MRIKVFNLLRCACSLVLLLLSTHSFAQVSPYPYEAYFKRHSQAAVGLWAARDYNQRTLSKALCPDTGLPVYSYALEGEWVTSPYTGRQIKQGSTGYFGAKSRDALGRIVAFGGDPLKYDLLPATARLLQHPNDSLVKAYLSIPGNLNQQYHFACSNWARFYGLVGQHMPTQWHAAFQAAVADYADNRRPSDGAREHNPLEYAYTLVGKPDADGVLGGSKTAGGTENHKLMWRTSALLYAQWFPDTARISGFSTAETERLTAQMLRDYLRKVGQTGNGEYDSEIYYPHVLQPFLNLYDFAPKTEYRRLAHQALDYYLASYGLKVLNGSIAGAQKRGFVPTKADSEMSTWIRAFADTSTHDLLPISLYQATTAYRPNRIICNIINKKIRLPFEAQMARPTYHLDVPNAFQESFYCSDSFALGNVAMTMVDNPNQQVVWSLVAKGKEQNLVFMGQQPNRLLKIGHSPYTQTLHHQNTILVMSAPTGKRPQSPLSPEQKARFQHAEQALVQLPRPDTASSSQLEQFVAQSAYSAATWLLVPRQAQLLRQDATGLYIEAAGAYVYVRPLSEYFWVDASAEVIGQIQNAETRAVLGQYRILVCTGNYSGYILEAAEKSAVGSAVAFQAKIRQSTQVKLGQGAASGTVTYRSLQGNTLKMSYNPTGLRAKGWLNGKAVDYSRWANGGVYDSPYVKLRNGVLTVTDGTEQFSIDFNQQP